MKVSILIPTRNRRGYLEQSLLSARRQTHENLEIIVSDDGSSDGTPEYVHQIALDDSRVRMASRNPTPGAFPNIRHLVTEASGDAIAILGDDDLLEPGYVAGLAAGLKDPSITAAFCRHGVIDSNGASAPKKAARIERDHRYGETAPGKIAEPIRPALLGQMWLGSCIFRTALLRSMDFDAACGSAADWDLAIRMASVGPSFFVPDVLWHYRDHAATISRMQDISRRRDAVTVLQKHRFADGTLEALRVAILRRRLAGLAWALGGTDPLTIGPVLSEYRRIGGRRLSALYLGPTVLERLPRPMAVWLRRGLDALRGI